jgi:mevalonate kinase
MKTQSPIINRQSEISASAPGSLMLLGEHAVLHGRRAMVCAINKRITVALSQIKQPVLRIVSDLGAYEAPLGALKDHPDFRFVLDAVRQYSPEQGIELKIESEFSSDIGFGSSAAVTVATHAALMQRVEPDRRAGFKMELFKRSLATIHRVQGRGSGADVAASVFGGVVAYRAEPLEIQQVGADVQNVEQASRLLSASGRSTKGEKRAGRSFYFPLTAVYSGAKMKTADVIRLVEERRALNPEYFERIFDRMDASVGEVIQAAEVERDRRARLERDRRSRSTQNQTTFLECLGRNLILNQKLMEEMGLCNAALAEIIGEFQSLEVPAKISGSGLGDCAIGLGDFPTIGKFQTYSLKVDPCGVL